MKTVPNSLDNISFKARKTGVDFIDNADFFSEIVFCQRNIQNLKKI